MQLRAYGKPGNPVPVPVPVPVSVPIPVPIPDFLVFHTPCSLKLCDWNCSKSIQPSTLTYISIIGLRTVHIKGLH